VCFYRVYILLCYCMKLVTFSWACELPAGFACSAFCFSLLWDIWGLVSCLFRSGFLLSSFVFSVRSLDSETVV
jgi:hypothetical protein